MKKFILEQSDEEFYTSHSNLALIGLCINRLSGLPQQIAKKMTGQQDKITHADIVRSMLGLLCLGKSDYEAVSAMREMFISSSPWGLFLFLLRSGCGSALTKMPQRFCRSSTTARWRC